MTKKTPTAVCSTVNPSTSINVDSLLCDADALALTIGDMVQASASIARGVRRAVAIDTRGFCVSRSRRYRLCAHPLRALRLTPTTH